MFGYKIFNYSNIYDLTLHNNRNDNRHYNRHDNRHIERKYNMEYRVKVIDGDGICHTYENIVGLSFYSIKLDMVQRYRSCQVGIDCFRHIILDMEIYRHVKIEKMIVSH